MCDDPLPKGVCSTIHVAALESWSPTNLALLFEPIQMFLYPDDFFFLLSWHSSLKKNIDPDSPLHPRQQGCCN